METDDTKTSGQKRGRPSKKEELEIERQLRNCFLQGKSPWAASGETGHSVNTVRKYKRFYAEAREAESPEFVEACKERIVSARLALERQLQKLEKVRDELEKVSPQNGTQYIQINKLRINVVQAITDLHLKILNIANSPTVDELLAALRSAGELE
ncbi:MAG: hypothetical protein KGI25_00910 [Thaumarchaeota archaeon]|nr:hypothetical protein [Nitrososphaerota archaeon]